MFILLDQQFSAGVIFAHHNVLRYFWLSQLRSVGATSNLELDRDQEWTETKAASRHSKAGELARRIHGLKCQQSGG